MHITLRRTDEESAMAQKTWPVKHSALLRAPERFVSRGAIQELVHRLTTNLVNITDETGEFLLRLDDGRVIDTKGWSGWEWTHGVGLYGIWQYYDQTGDVAMRDIVDSWFAARLAQGVCRRRRGRHWRWHGSTRHPRPTPVADRPARADGPVGGDERGVALARGARDLDAVRRAATRPALVGPASVPGMTQTPGTLVGEDQSSNACQQMALRSR
jgi:glycosyl hydrolase family 88